LEEEEAEHLGAQRLINQCISFLSLFSPPVSDLPICLALKWGLSIDRVRRCSHTHLSSARRAAAPARRRKRHDPFELPISWDGNRVRFLRVPDLC
jgi:hypothetical protein